MVEQLNLKEIEKKAYQFTFKDGLYDMAYGLLLVLVSIAPILREMIYLGYIFFLIFPAPLIIILGKRYVTIPRIGIVKFSQKRTKSQSKILLLIAVLVPLTVLMVILTFLGMFNVTVGGYIVPVGAGLFALILLSLVAYFIDYSHFYLYGISIGLGIPVAEVLEPLLGDLFNYVVCFGISGALIFMYGLLTFITFVQKYPIPNEELPDVN
jgi:hypothetical protein